MRSCHFVAEVTFKEKKVSGEIACALISLFLVQIEKACKLVNYLESICFLQNLLSFIITKNLKQEIHDDISIFNVTWSKGNDITNPKVRRARQIAFINENKFVECHLCKSQKPQFK